MMEHDNSPDPNDAPPRAPSEGKPKKRRRRKRDMIAGALLVLAASIATEPHIRALALKLLALVIP